MEHIRDLIEAVAKAKRDAYATAPRDSNEHLEAAIFVAMALAMDGYFRGKVAAGELAPSPIEDVSAVDLAVPGVVDPLPPPVTEDAIDDDLSSEEDEWVDDDSVGDETDKPKRKKKKAKS